MWAAIKHRILELSDNDLDSQDRIKQISHRKACLQYEITNFENKKRQLKKDQSVVVDLKVEFQKISAKYRVRQIGSDLFLEYWRQVAKIWSQLHQSGVMQVEKTNKTSDLVNILSNLKQIDALNLILKLYFDEEVISSKGSEVYSDEENLSIEWNEITVKDMIHKKGIKGQEKVFDYDIRSHSHMGSPNKPYFFKK